LRFSRRCDLHRCVVWIELRYGLKRDIAWYICDRYDCVVVIHQYFAFVLYLFLLVANGMEHVWEAHRDCQECRWNGTSKISLTHVAQVENPLTY
jgi:hypothetical protein